MHSRDEAFNLDYLKKITSMDLFLSFAKILPFPSSFGTVFDLFPAALFTCLASDQFS